MNGARLCRRALYSFSRPINNEYRMSDTRTNKKKKPSFVTRMKNRGREIKMLGTVLADEPKSFPSALLRVIKKSLRTIWDARGGGLYACGFLLTFVYLEIRMFFVDIFNANSIGDYFSEQISEMLFKYIGQSFENTISAFMWPVYIIELNATWGAIALGALFVIFPKYLKKPLERWLFGDSTQTHPADTP